ncbi:MAG TPA: GDP-mannose 4,6-dehydratase [Gemmatimonadaceae bacterium]|nr:GDP-mannose 4,6-dehydratase [Gemmatimonadaceae bacterium]
MRALVTGAAGFVGQWLCGALLREGWEVYGARLDADARPAHSGASPGGLTSEEASAVRWLSCDVTSSADMAGALDEAAPDAVFHLAGVAFVPDAGSDPAGALAVNTVSAARLLAQLRERKHAGTLDPVVIIVGSGEQYGAHRAEEQPLCESADQRPVTVYAASKAAQEVIALQACRADGLRVIATRPFNHSGRGQSSRFVIPALVRRALDLRGTPGAVLSIGNTTPIRDFLHVADVVRAYILLAERGEPGEVYNISSGKGVAIGVLASRILAMAGTDATLESDPSLVRPVDVPILVGDPSRLQDATGWSAEHSLDTIIEDVIRATAH